PGEASLGGGPAEAVERAEDHILFVGGPSGRASELPASPLDQLAVIRLPELLRRRRIAGLELADPVADRACGEHRFLPSGTRTLPIGKRDCTAFGKVPHKDSRITAAGGCTHGIWETVGQVCNLPAFSPGCKPFMVATAD